MNLHIIIQRIANKNNEDIQFLYGKYYKKLQEKYPELKIVKCERSKLKQIQEQGYEEKLIDIIKEDHPKEFDFMTLKYTDKQKLQIMVKELNLIGGSEEQNDINDDIKHFTLDVLLKIPDYWWVVPASSSGLYHPSFSCETNGLVKHTKATIQIALTLFEVNVFDFTQRDRGIILASLILHDTFKSGLEYGQTKFDHPKMITDFIEENSKIMEKIPKEDFDKLKSAINCHMGKWNTKKNSKLELPLPKTKMDYFVHICDLLSSRKYMSFNFDKDFEI